MCKCVVVVVCACGGGGELTPTHTRADDTAGGKGKKGGKKDKGKKGKKGGKKGGKEEEEDDGAAVDPCAALNASVQRGFDAAKAALAGVDALVLVQNAHREQAAKDEEERLAALNAEEDPKGAWRGVAVCCGVLRGVARCCEVFRQPGVACGGAPSCWAHASVLVFTHVCACVHACDRWLAAAW